MKMSSFLILSMALHAAALAYPALRLVSRTVDPVVVTVIDAAGENGGAAKGEGAGQERKPALVSRKALAPAKRAMQLAAEFAQVAELPAAIYQPVVSSDASGAIAVANVETREIGYSETSSASNGVEPSGHGAGESRQGGSGQGGAGTGSGRGAGNGNGATAFVQPRYDYCPKPDYPQTASREGWEGKVTLRVLVDEEGKPKSIEVYRSSGFAILDQAAVENVKRRCRFYPARDGDKRVEQWTRIPVEFAVRNRRN
jgi:protein TonB